MALLYTLVNWLYQQINKLNLKVKSLASEYDIIYVDSIRSYWVGF